MSSSTHVKVGFVFFLGLAVFAVVTIMVGQGEFSLRNRGYCFDVIFDSVGGLRKNESVELGGMEAGKVKSLSIEGNKIRVGLRINEGIEIKKDCSITILEKSLLGGRVVSISMGSPGEQQITPGTTMKGEIVPGVTELIARASHLEEKIEQVLSEIEKPVSELNSVLKSIGRIADKIEKGKGIMGKLVNDEKLGESMEKTLTRMEDAGTKMNSALQSIGRITDKIEKGEGTLGKFVTQEDMYEEITETLESVKAAGEKVTEFTRCIEQIKTYIGVDSAYNEKNEHVLTKVYLRIEPIPDKLYIVGANALTGPGTEWDKEDKLDVELDLQLGKRFFNNRFTGRIGIFESRVGAGFDIGLNKNFTWTVEGRDTWKNEKDENIDPFLLRSRIQWRVWRGIYIHAGADNILDEPAFNVGIRLEYYDEHVKYLVSTIAAGT